MTMQCRNRKEPMNPTIEPLERELQLDMGPVSLRGILAVPPQPRGLVLFPYCRESGRLSPLPREVADSLRETRLATLVIDLLTPEEDRSSINRCNLDLLTERLAGAVDWVGKEAPAGDLPLGFLGGGTVAAAAFMAVADLGKPLRALVVQSGRIDLAGDALGLVRIPTLLIVGENDHPILEINRRCYQLLRGIKELVVIPGASHTFKEPGALEDVCRLTREWLVSFLPR